MHSPAAATTEETPARHGEDAQHFDVGEGAEYGAETVQRKPTTAAASVTCRGGRRGRRRWGCGWHLRWRARTSGRRRRGGGRGGEELVGVRLLTEVALDEGLQERELDADVVHPEGHERRGGDLPRGGGAGHGVSKRNQRRDAGGGRSASTPEGDETMRSDTRRWTRLRGGTSACDARAPCEALAAREAIRFPSTRDYM